MCITLFDEHCQLVLKGKKWNNIVNVHICSAVFWIFPCFQNCSGSCIFAPASFLTILSPAVKPAVHRGIFWTLQQPDVEMGKGFFSPVDSCLFGRHYTQTGVATLELALGLSLDRVANELFYASLLQWLLLQFWGWAQVSFWEYCCSQYFSRSLHRLFHGTLCQGFFVFDSHMYVFFETIWMPAFRLVCGGSVHWITFFVPCRKKLHSLIYCIVNWNRVLVLTTIVHC